MPTDHSFETRFGAEAKIEQVDWYGKPAIRKIRIPKDYRSKSLDSRLRTSRTKAEAELLHSARLAGVLVPEVYFANPEESEIIMEFVNGRLLKELKREEIEHGIFETLGMYAARLHEKGIIHGDMTTKNVIRYDNRITLIDFGLAFYSERLEDKAEDIHLLKQAIKGSGLDVSTHFESILRGYNKEIGSREATKVRNQILEIERRGRYARVD
jgi:TP53 regulating kinase-like protein